MKSRKDFFLGMVVGMIIISIITSLYFGIKEFDYYLDDKGIVLVEKDYETYEDKLNDILKTIDNKYLEEFEAEDLFETAYKGFVSGVGDPYTNYYTKDEYKSFMELTAGSYQGIGVIISYGETNDEIIVEAPYKGSPGYKAGLLPQDRIIKVDGVEVSGMELTDIVKLIKGEKGTDVVLTIVRDGEPKPLDITITRDKIDIPTIEYEMLDNNIGYIAISSFDQITYKQFMEGFNELENKNQNGLIIDLRNNPGGLIHTVGAITDEFVPKGELIVYTENKDGVTDLIEADKKSTFDKPLVILVNQNSASASEIMAGAIKDHNLGTIVGTTTFGKGLVQTTHELDDGSALKITIAKYFTPNGNYIHDKGIEPNVVVELPEDLRNSYEIDKEDDTQLQKAIEIINNKIQK